jgi:hypothetical protein
MLTTCTNCGKPVSDRAVKCPHCGCANPASPINTEENPAAQAEEEQIVQAQEEQIAQTQEEEVERSSGPNPAEAIVKMFLALVIIAGSVMCILPLFTNFYERGWAPALGYYLPITYVLVGYGIIAGVASFALAIYGIVRLCTNRLSTWTFWLLTTLFAGASVWVVFLLVDRNEVAYFEYRHDKNEAGKGTYECHLPSGDVLTFSVGTDAGCELLESTDSTTRIGACSIRFSLERNKYQVNCYIQENDYGKEGDEGKGYFSFEVDEDMGTIHTNEYTYLHLNGQNIQLNKISDEVRTVNYYLERAEQERQAKEAEERARLEREEQLAKAFINKYFYSITNPYDYSSLKTIMTPTYYKEYYRITNVGEADDDLHCIGTSEDFDPNYSKVESITSLGNSWYEISFYVTDDTQYNPSIRTVKWKIIIVNGIAKIDDIEE